MSGRIGTAMGAGFNAVPMSLKRIAAGYVDEEVVRVRKMAAAGATDGEISAACGKRPGWAAGYIRRNGIIWNQKSEDRHLMKSAQTIGVYIAKGRYDWNAKAKQMREAGASIAAIAAEVGQQYGTVSGYLNRNKIRPPRREKGSPPRVGEHDHSAAMRAAWARRKAAGWEPKPVPATSKREMFTRMRDLIIRLHAEEVLSEGQVAHATGLDRASIRRLVDAARAAA